MKFGNFIDAVYDKKNDKVIVWERSDSKRHTVTHAAQHYFYVKDENGSYKSIYGEPLSKLEFDNRYEFYDAAKKFKDKYESDLSPVEKILMNKYIGIPMPPLHASLLDIEVDYKAELGFSSVANPYAPINAITIYHQWQNKYVTLAIPPESWRNKNLSDELLSLSNIFLCKDEKELLLKLLDEIEDSDILSGWNSDFFDLPYIMKRLERVLGKPYLNKLSFEHANEPYFSEIEKFGNKEITGRISGRVHLDYLQLFKKFTYEGRSSYSLANIAEEELDIPKIEYDGTLEDLYNRDFDFFLRYNIRDTEILVKLDEKFKFINLANQMAHENTVTFDAIFGSVRIIDTGIINYAHEQGLIVKDKEMKNGDPIEGALVMEPRIGMHEWIGSCDINSLYPSTYRSLNLSPEKIVGQFTNYEEDWNGIINEDDKEHRLILEDGNYADYTGVEWKQILMSQKWAISAYGTVLNQHDGQGIIPGLLTLWYAERKKMQAEKKKFGELAKSFEDKGILILEDFQLS